MCDRNNDGPMGCLRAFKIVITFFAVLVFSAIAFIVWQALPYTDNNEFTVIFSWALRLGMLFMVLLSACGFVHVLRRKERTIVDVAREMRDERGG